MMNGTTDKGVVVGGEEQAKQSMEQAEKCDDDNQQNRDNPEDEAPAPLVIPPTDKSLSSSLEPPSPPPVNHATHPNNNPSSQGNSSEKCVEAGATVVAAATAAKRVRFSICEYITETLVREEATENGSHFNAAFVGENETDQTVGGKKIRMEGKTDSGEDSGVDGGSKVRYIGGKLRRDSVHPLVPQFHEHLGAPGKKKRDKNWDVILPSGGVGDIEEKGSGGVPWSDLSTKGKILRVLMGLGKFLALLALLYFFVCSLDLLALGFRLVGGSTAGEIFQKSSILQNPVVGLMLGILTTVLVQSSSTSTSILVGMVAAGFMDVRIAIPPIMGANIGTSITNTIVSFTQAGDRSQFRRAFAGATILDMFNWITVLVLLPIEVVFGYLYWVSKATTDLLIPDSQSGGEIQLLSVLTNPFVDLIVQLNDTVLDCWANPNCTEADDASLIKEWCGARKTEIVVQERVVDFNGNEVINIREVARQEDLQKCDFLFAGTSLSDIAAGCIILAASLFVLCLCLVMIVKLLNSVIQGHVSTVIKTILNADIPYVPWVTGYIAILVGALMTFLVQSSSVFTSALTPLVGMGVISLSRVYPLTLGANIGTTTTAILASMAAEGKSLHPSLQIALCHFFFNITGVILFYPLPFLRFPIGMAKVLGNITAKYRWFAIFYLIAMFGVIPLIFILLSLAGSIYVIILVSVLGAVAALVALITILQTRFPQILPTWLQDWSWLPRPLRSLKPYDKLITKMPCCRGKGSSTQDNDSSDDNSDNSDDDEYTYSKTRSSLDNDFVYLTGNKIPPPGGDSLPRPPIITRIVPTRVIRQISTPPGESPQLQHNTSNGNGNISLSPNGSTKNNGRGSSLNYSNGNGLLSNSTLPPPTSSPVFHSNGANGGPHQEESLSSQNGVAPQNNNSNSSVESFLV